MNNIISIKAKEQNSSMEMKEIITRYHITLQADVQEAFQAAEPVKIRKSRYMYMMGQRHTGEFSQRWEGMIHAPAAVEKNTKSAVEDEKA